MRFCAVLGTHPIDTPGGAELQAQYISAELARRGHETHYVAHESDETKTTVHDGVTIHRLSSKNSVSHLVKTIRKLRQLDPDILYFRLLPELPLATLAKKATDAYLVFNISHNAHCLPRFASWPGKDSETTIHDIYRRSNLAFQRTLLSIPDTILAQTEVQQHLLNANWRIDSALTGNGHPVPSSEPEKHSPPVVLWLASIKPFKQPHVFVDVAEKCQDLDCEFWMVGQPTHTELADEIQERVDTIANIDYFGGCSIPESNEYLEKASVFVNTSSMEGYPNTFIQAWFRKTPVVTMGADPAGDRSSHQTGYYNLSDADEIETQVRTLIENPSQRDSLATQAYEHALEHNDIRTVVDRIEAELPAHIVES